MNIDKYINSHDVTKYVLDNNIQLPDKMIASIVYNSHFNFPDRNQKLLEIKDQTTDNQLKNDIDIIISGKDKCQDVEWLKTHFPLYPFMIPNDFKLGEIVRNTLTNEIGIIEYLSHYNDKSKPLDEMRDNVLGIILVFDGNYFGNDEWFVPIIERIDSEELSKIQTSDFVDIVSEYLQGSRNLHELFELNDHNDD